MIDSEKNIGKKAKGALKDVIKRLKGKDYNNVAGPGGFEPPTCGLGGRRAILATLRAHLYAIPMVIQQLSLV